MFGHVIETLLSNPVDQFLKSRRQAIRVARNPQSRFGRWARPKLAANCRNAAANPKRSSTAGLKAAMVRRKSTAARSAMPRARRRRRRTAPELTFDQLQFQPQRQQGLGGLIVQFAADTAAFLFLSLPAERHRLAQFRLQAATVQYLGHAL